MIKRPLLYLRRGFTYAMIASMLGTGALRLTPHTRAAAPSAKKTIGKANAATLLKDAERSLAYIIKHAKADKGLSPTIAKNKPFWQALQKIAKNLDAAAKGLKEKNKSFYKAISDARTAEESMKAAWPLTDSKNKEVIDGGRKLGHALALLRTKFSQEAARAKKGGNLSDKEKAEMAKLKAEQKKQLALINKLLKKHAKNKALCAGLKKMRGRCRHALKEPLTPAGYASLFFTVDIIEGEFASYEFYVEKEDRTEWQTAEHEYTETVETIETEEEAEEPADFEEVTSEEVEIPEDEAVEDAEIDSEPDADIQEEEDSVEEANYEETPEEEEEVAEQEENDEQAGEESDGEDEGDSMEDASDDEGEDDDGGGADEGGDEGGDED